MRFFNLITGWKREYTAEGLVLLPPTGMAEAAIQIHERKQPMHSLKHVLRDIISRCEPAIRQSARIGPAERIVTAAGEYAALGSIHATTSKGQPYEHVVAMVLCDDYYVLIEGIVVEPKLADTVREAVRILATDYYSGLGELRQRPFLYNPPKDWRPIVGAHVTRFYSPRHPTLPGVIHMFHARPAAVTDQGTLHRMLFMDTSTVIEKDLPLPAKTFKTRHGLFGELVKQTGRDRKGKKVVGFQATLVDKRFLYLSRLDTIDEEADVNLATFVEVLETATPVPSPVRQAAGGSDLIHWAD